ncbi:MAG: hypothetical protein HY279_07905 [Nitrospinae bacterium]|nr:hypothetical protein [Nitrospinota bacterium]
MSFLRKQESREKTEILDSHSLFKTHRDRFHGNDKWGISGWMKPLLKATSIIQPFLYSAGFLQHRIWA